MNEPGGCPGENIPEETVRSLPLQGHDWNVQWPSLPEERGMVRAAGDETKRHQNGQMALGLVSPRKDSGFYFECNGKPEQAPEQARDKFQVNPKKSLWHGGHHSVDRGRSRKEVKRLGTRLLSKTQMTEVGDMD